MAKKKQVAVLTDGQRRQRERLVNTGRESARKVMRPSGAAQGGRRRDRRGDRGGAGRVDRHGRAGPPMVRRGGVAAAVDPGPGPPSGRRTRRPRRG